MLLGFKQWKFFFVGFAFLTMIGMLWDGPAQFGMVSASISGFNDFFAQVFDVQTVTTQVQPANDENTLPLGFLSGPAELLTSLVRILLLDYTLFEFNVWTQFIRLILIITFSAPMLLPLIFYFISVLGGLIGGILGRFT